LLEGSDVRTKLQSRLRLTACPTVVSPHPALDRMRFLFTMSDIERPQPQAGQSLPNRAFRALRRGFSPLARSPRRNETDQISSERTKGRPARRALASSNPAPRQILRLVKSWWSQTGSNRRPHACKARALPTELWPRQTTDDRPQTTDKATFRRLSSALRRPIMVGLGGLEPPTSRLSSARSNQLSYKPGRKL
jgi:hypothetical protein